MKEKILVIEDIPEMSELICLYLQKDNFETKPCFSGEEAFEAMANGFKPDLVVLDLNLPGMSGFEFLKKFRENFKKIIPVIIVSARDADEDIIESFDFGADDFITKPFKPKILVARIKSKLTRLNETQASVEETYTFGGYTIYFNSCVLKAGSKRVQLSAKEYDVLEYLVRHKNEKLSPDQIYKDVWNNQFGDVTAVAVYIQRLRKKIEEDCVNPVYIKTVFGQGYIFEG